MREREHEREKGGVRESVCVVCVHMRGMYERRVYERNVVRVREGVVYKCISSECISSVCISSVCISSVFISSPGSPPSAPRASRRMRSAVRRCWRMRRAIVRRCNTPTLPFDWSGPCLSDHSLYTPHLMRRCNDEAMQ
jgi:hypothetical protein